MDGERVALEEIGEVDEVLARLGVGVGAELIVGEVEAEDIRVDDDDTAGGVGGADGIGGEVVEGGDGAGGKAGMD